VTLPSTATTRRPLILSLSKDPPKAPRPRTSARCAGSGRNREAVDANERSEDNFCSMKITQEVREFAASQAANSDLPGAGRDPEPGSSPAPQGAVDASEAEQGMRQMAEKYRAGGSELYVGAGGREHD
jgi:hypothetical protein